MESKHIVGDFKKALEILEPLAEQGDADAHYSLATMYDKGLGVEQDDKQALRYYKKAAELGDVSTQYLLGLRYQGGTGGVKQDLKQAAHWYRKAAEQGSVASQIHLANMYIWGEGVEKSDLEAYKWYSLAYIHLNLERTFWDKVSEWLTEIYLDFKLSSDQKKEADEWVKNWKPKYGK